ncbi:MAG: DoxX family membrane protein [Anaerolineales bacterium]|nr:DoxX family membrane protein [Anaerolineales bacterium]
MATLTTRAGSIIQNPPFVQKLLNDKRSTWLWLLPRLWLGYKWIDAALHKVGNPAWVSGGEALKGYWLGAIAIPEAGRPAIAFDWDRSFLQILLDAQTYTWFAKLVAYGELLVGIALILGTFTGIAAFFGALMNWNFMLAGSASTNPVLFIVAVGLILAWKVSGYIGADYFLLPWIGTPWTPGASTSQSVRTLEPSPVRVTVDE